MKRSPNMQSDNNLKIRQIEIKLTSQGWNVKADLPGYEKPARRLYSDEGIGGSAAGNADSFLLPAGL